MKIKIESDPAAYMTDKDQTMGRVIALLLKGFPTIEDVVKCIEDSISVIQESDQQWKCKNAALEIVWSITSLFLFRIMDAKTNGQKEEVAREVVEYLIINYTKGSDSYIKALSMLENGYIDTFDLDGPPFMEARCKVYQFDALKEIGKMMQE